MWGAKAKRGTHGLSSKPLSHSLKCSLGGFECLVVPLKNAQTTLRPGAEAERRVSPLRRAVCASAGGRT